MYIQLKIEIQQLKEPVIIKILNYIRLRDQRVVILKYISLSTNVTLSGGMFAEGRGLVVLFKLKMKSHENKQYP
jgi:hypothetical protein